MAALRAVALFTAGAASAQGVNVLDVLLAALRAGARVPASVAAAVDNAPPVAAARAPLAKRGAATGTLWYSTLMWHHLHFSIYVVTYVSCNIYRR